MSKLYFEDEEKSPEESVTETIYFASRRKRQQKRRIKLEQAKRAETVKSAESIAGAVKKTAKSAKTALESIPKNKSAIIVLGILAGILMIVMFCVSSCSILFEGFTATVSSAASPISDEEQTNIDEAYTELESDLRAMLYNYEDEHDFDYCEFFLDEISHDRNELIALVSALREGELEYIFSQQYRLSETIHVVGGDVICTVELTNTPLIEVAELILTDEQYDLFELYLEINEQEEE